MFKFVQKLMLHLMSKLTSTALPSGDLFQEFSFSFLNIECLEESMHESSEFLEISSLFLTS